MMQSEINIAIQDKLPFEYFSILLEQVEGGNLSLGGITDQKQIQDNFTAHCLPEGMETKTVDNYEDFLSERRKLMANKIRHYYYNL